MEINNDTWSVYIHIFPNNKYYVGITSISPEERWGKGGCNYIKQSVYNAIQKYGWENIEHFIFAKNLTQAEASQMEQLLIEKLDSYKNGYNNTFGGEGKILYSLQTRLEMKQQWDKGYKVSQISKQFNCVPSTVKHILLTLGVSEEEYNLRSKNHSENGLDQKILELWNKNISRDEIAKIVGRSSRGVTLSLNRSGVSLEERATRSYLIREKPVLQYDQKGNFISEYRNALDASLILTNSNSIEKDIKNSCMTRKKINNYFWRYKETESFPLILQDIIRDKIYIYKDDVFIQSFSDVKQAINWLIDNNLHQNKKFNTMRRYIYRDYKKENNNIFGFHWVLNNEECDGKEAGC